MNAYPDFVEFFKQVSKSLQLLSQESGKINLFFVDGPENADTVLNELKNRIGFPCLLVEYYDEDVRDDAGKFTSISGAFVILQSVSKKVNGQDSVRNAIYEDAKPAADQVLAYMQKLSSTGRLKFDNKPATLLPDAKGLWVGPLHSDLYGWRYEFTWRIAAGACFDPDHWVLQ
jgi:hypothetical protein